MKSFSLPTLLASLCVLSSFSAQAQVVGQDVSVSCRPNIPYTGEVTSLVIKKGPAAAMNVEFTEGMHGRATQAKFVVEKTNSNDMSKEFYNGDGFSFLVQLQTDSTPASTELFAMVNGVPTHLTNLTCIFNENNPYPGVSMGN